MTSSVGAARIVHIATYLQGGAGRVIAELALEQKRRGDDPVVACATESVEGYGHYRHWIDALRRAAIPVIELSCTFRRSLHHLMGAVEGLEAAIAGTARPAIVHAHAAVPALVGLNLSCASPVIATMHGWSAHKTREQVATDVAVFNRLPAVAVPSRAASRHLVDVGVRGKGIHVIPYGVAPAVSHGLAPGDRAPLDKWRQQGRLITLCIGSIGERKRQAILLEALARPAVRARTACVFIGEGSTVPALQARARELRIDDSVAWPGCRDDVADWLREADVAVFPSSREGMPVGLLEAAAEATMPLVSDIDEHCEFVESNVSGLVFATDDVHSLEHALERALSMSSAERAALGRAAQARWARDHRPEAMHAAYDHLYALARARDNRDTGRWSRGVQV